MTRKIHTDIISLVPKASLAQLVEQLIRNEQVVGSNPIASSSFEITKDPRRKFVEDLFSFGFYFVFKFSIVNA